MNSENTYSTDLISSLDVIEKTKISRATLNNYIKRGLLPRPVIKRPADEKIKARQIGYFPKSVLERIDRIKEMKREGMNVNRIVEKLLDERSADLLHTPLRETLKTDVDWPYGADKRLSLKKDEIDTSKSTNVKLSNDQTSLKILKDIKTIIITREDTLKLLMNNPQPAPTHFSILAARLDNEKHLQMELMGSEYQKLLKQIIMITERILIQYTGVYGKNYGNRILYYFIKNEQSNYLMDSIYTAFQLKRSMDQISDEWKSKKGWAHDICLNTGISDDYNDMNIKPSLLSFEFSSHGDSADMAEKLSQFATKGSIWTTKAMMNKLSQEEQRKINFGIKSVDKENLIFIKNTFTRMMDRDKISVLSDPEDAVVYTLPITEIIAVI